MKRKLTRNLGSQMCRELGLCSESDFNKDDFAEGTVIELTEAQDRVLSGHGLVTEPNDKPVKAVAKQADITAPAKQ